jgi:acylphosphatase
MVAKIIRVRGLVQGVFYRESLRREAEMREISGWVRNREDKSVEAFLQGEASKIEELIAWSRIGPPRASVEKVEVSQAEVDSALQSFTRKETI